MKKQAITGKLNPTTVREQQRKGRIEDVWKRLTFFTKLGGKSEAGIEEGGRSVELRARLTGRLASCDQQVVED